MLFTKNKPMEEILESLGSEEAVFLLACNGCAESCGTGGQSGLSNMKAELEKTGRNVTATSLVDFLCNKMLVATRLSRQMQDIDKADSILVLTCGIGVQAVSKVINKVVHPADDTISLGGLQGLWPADERCGTCGQCSLDHTGGICPVTMCAKSLLNGPCGGQQDGKCEIDTQKDCGWNLIYERLKKIGRLENLRKIRTPRDHSKMAPSHDLRSTTFYDFEM
jgi:hypothetical protein